MTSKYLMEDFELLNNADLVLAMGDPNNNVLDSSCLREHVLSPLKMINSLMERLDITLFESNSLVNDRTPIARISHPFFSLGKIVVISREHVFLIYIKKDNTHTQK